MKLQKSALIQLPLVAILLSILSIDNSSLWVDEIGTWAITQHSSWLAWADALWNHFNSDGQLPLYHAYMKIWVDLLGDSARTLRLSNTPWAILALIALWRLPSENIRLKFWLILFFCIHAFVWYYLNETRPYIILVAGAAWFITGVFRISKDESKASEIDIGVKEALAGATIIITGNILGGLWIASTLLAFLITYPKILEKALRSALKQYVYSLMCIIIILTITGIALHSFSSGARASQLAAFSLPGFIYGLIELTGATGLGPSRHELRASLSNVSIAELLLMLGLATLCSWSILQGWLALSIRFKIFILIAAILPLIGMILIGSLLHWRVVGRHLSAILPLVIIALAYSADQAIYYRPQNYLAKTIILLTILGLIASSLSMRLSERHKKDDYQTASSWAQASLAKGKTVLWTALPEGLVYYKVVPSAEKISETTNLYTYKNYWKKAELGQLPDTIIISPREAIDPEGKTREIIRKGKYMLVARSIAFELYERK